VKQGKQKKIANQLFAGWSFNTDKHDIHTATIINFLTIPLVTDIYTNNQILGTVNPASSIKDTAPNKGNGITDMQNVNSLPARMSKPCRQA